MQKKQKMYVVTNPMPEHNNSSAVSLGKFVQVILHAGFSPTVIGARFRDGTIPGVPDIVPVVNFRYGGKSVAKILSFILLQLKHFFYGLAHFRRGDAVYFWIADKMLGGFLAARLKGAETNYFLYGNVFGDGKGGMSEKLVRYMMNRASCVCVEAPSVLKQWGDFTNRKWDSINLFVPEVGIQPVPYENREKTVAMYCRISIGKHIDDAVLAFCKIHERLPEYRLKIIGSGAIENEMRDFIRERGAEDFVTLTGWLDREEALMNLRDCRVLLYPTDAEGVPGGILEAMSLGVPALASPVGGIPDIIDDGVDGVILTGTDAENIERELTALLESDKLSALSDAALRKIENKFSLAAAAENFRRVRESHK